MSPNRSGFSVGSDGELAAVAMRLGEWMSVMVTQVDDLSENHTVGSHLEALPPYRMTQEQL